MRTCLIGALPLPIGGTTVSFKNLVDALREKGEDITVINLSNYKKFYRTPLLFAKILEAFFKTDVITLHIGINSLIYIGFYVRVLSFLFGKPYIIRRFGGVCLSELNFFKKYFCQFIYKGAASVLSQTKPQYEESKQFTSTAWFPTSRKKNEKLFVKSNKLEKFIYIGQIKKEKGVFELLNCFKAFTKAYTDVTLAYYGPLFDGIKAEDLTSEFSFYGGVIPSEKVQSKLHDSDVLILPTYYSGEGYPGIIVESLMSYTPVITTRWKSIPELVDNTCSIIVEPKDEEELLKAMTILKNNEDQLNSLREGAYIKSDVYTIDKQLSLFITVCKKALIHK